MYPIPGIRAVTRVLLVNRTFAIWRRAEFGFLGVMVVTRVIVPFTCGRLAKAGVREKGRLLYFHLRLADWDGEAKYKHGLGLKKNLKYKGLSS